MADDGGGPLPARLIDAALEATVVGSYSRIGWAVRRRLFDLEPLPEGAMAGRTVVVTGATSGVGRAAATELGRLGAHVWVVGRDAKRAAEVAAEVEGRGGRATVQVTDLADLAATRELAARVAAAHDVLWGLVHAAGALLHRRTETPQGLETTFAVHVVSPFLLTATLVGRLRQADPGRVVFVSSGGMYAARLDLSDLQSRRGPWRGSLVYARAKRAQVLLAREWARRLRDRGVVVHAMHPGWAATPGVEASLPRFHRVLGPVLRTPAEAADTVVWLLASPEAARTTGGFWLDRRPRPVDLVPWTRSDPSEVARLWDEVARLSGFDGDLP